MITGRTPVVSSPGSGRGNGGVTEDPSSTFDVDKDLTLPKGVPPPPPRPAKGPRKGKPKDTAAKGKESKSGVKESWVAEDSEFTS